MTTRARWYTVILLRPDYMTDNYGQDTWMDSIRARDPEEAVKLARGECHLADNEGCNGILDMLGSPDDYSVIAVIRGKHNDLNPGV